MINTIKEIEKHFPELPIKEVYNSSLAGYSLSEIENKYHQTIITQDQYEAYCALWQNTCYRYSSVCASYAF